MFLFSSSFCCYELSVIRSLFPPVNPTKTIFSHLNGAMSTPWRLKIPKTFILFLDFFQFRFSPLVTLKVHQSPFIRNHGRIIPFLLESICVSPLFSKNLLFLLHGSTQRFLLSAGVPISFWQKALELEPNFRLQFPVSQLVLFRPLGERFSVP